MAVPANYNGTLNVNEIFTAIFNMIISQRVFSKNIAGDAYSLVDRHREEGSLYGDTVLFYSTDALYVEDYAPDTVDQLNLLATRRAPEPHCQAIVLDQGRFIQVTTDEYWSKRAWSTENVFNAYKDTTMKWLADTKKIYDETLFNQYIGNVLNDNTDADAQRQFIDYSTIIAPNATMDEEALRRLVAEKTAEALDNIATAMKDISRDFNDLQFTRKYDMNDFEIIWNADVVNYIRNTSLPSLFHNDGLLKIKEENILPRHYFGKATAVTANQVVGTDIAYGTVAFKHRVKLGNDTNNKDVYWAGQLCPVGYTTTGTDEYLVVDKFEDVINQTDPSETVICKIVHKSDFPYMSGYQTQREFINDKNLSKNHYLHFMHNTLTHINEYPLVTVSTGFTP